MKTDFKAFFEKALVWLRDKGRNTWIVLSRHWGMKLLSLLLAILLWNYVVTSNQLITRSKTLSGLAGYATSQATLSTYGLALLDNPVELIDDVSVRVEVSQSDFSQVSADNVQVTLDLSKVRTAGTQEVELKATSAYGRVTGIYPPTVTLTFEPLDSRSIPVNVSITGERNENTWYNVSRTNPSVLTVSGAASKVRSISQARVNTDVTGADAPYMRAEPYVLLDANGNEIDQSMLTRTSSSITVVADVYPAKDIPISAAVADVVVGRPAEGYVISDITIQPESITVAAEQALLDDITELLIEPISIEGQSRSVSARTRVATLSEFKYTSAQQVFVNIAIGEKDVSEWVESTRISFIGKAENLVLDRVGDPVRVYVTGPRSEVEILKKEGIPVTVDLTGLEAGSHSCELRFPAESYPDVTFEAETPTISVTLSPVAKAE